MSYQIEKNIEDPNTSRVRTRYTPSPMGRMHMGNLRTALYAYLIAKHEGGDFLLRIKDTDQERFVEGAVEIIYQTLKDTDLTHDEGPDKDGGCGPYVQSERQTSGIYLGYAKKLMEKGETYYCFCTPERLTALKTTINREEIMAYDKHCLHLTKGEVEANLVADVPCVIRQNNPTTGITTFRDETYGDIAVNNSELDNMVLIKSDGYSIYNLASMVNDHLMGITHVVRGNEYLSSSPKYNRLYAAFGWDVPVYVRCLLITDESHRKLSGRSGHSSFKGLLEQDFISQAVVNYVALLGWSPENNRGIFTLGEVAKEFDYHRMSKSPAVFGMTELEWMNGEYIRAIDFDTFYKMAEPYLKAAVSKDLDLRGVASMVKTRTEIFPDIADHVGFFKALLGYNTTMYTHKKMKTSPETSLKVLKDVLPLLEAQGDFTNDVLYDVLSEYVEDTGVEIGSMMWPIRTTVSGKQMTPAGATEVMEVLGKEESLARVRKGIQVLEA